MREDKIVEQVYLDSFARKCIGSGCSAAVAKAGDGVVFDAYLHFNVSGISSASSGISVRDVSGAGDDDVTAAGSVWTMAVISFLATLKLNNSRRKEGN
jgi:hypothetical protein